MTIDEVILELYRLAETKKWQEQISEEALSFAIEGMEHIREQKMMDKRKNAMVHANKKQPRIWC